MWTVGLHWGEGNEPSFEHHLSWPQSKQLRAMNQLLTITVVGLRDWDCTGDRALTQSETITSSKTITFYTTFFNNHCFLYQSKTITFYASSSGYFLCLLIRCLAVIGYAWGFWGNGPSPNQFFHCSRPYVSHLRNTGNPLEIVQSINCGPLLSIAPFKA